MGKGKQIVGFNTFLLLKDILDKTHLLASTYGASQNASATLDKTHF